MKRRHLWLVVLSLIFSICICFGIAACDDGDDGNEGSNGNYNEPAVSALTVPTVAIDENGKATWNEVSNASGYAFKINDGVEQAAEIKEVQLENGQSVAVKAKGDGVSYSDSDWSESKTYRAPAPRLTAPENLTVQIQGIAAGKVILSWDAVTGASGYKYMINRTEQDAWTVEETSVTVDLSEIDASKLDSTWTFRVKALGSKADGIADNGDYSDRRDASDYCKEVDFAVVDGEIYTAAEILKIMNYYGERLPNRLFMVTGTVSSNTNDNAVLENGFTLFGKYVPDLYLAVDESLAGLEVTVMGSLTAKDEAKGLSPISIDFENIAENDRYALVIDTLNAWNMLQEDPQIMGNFYLPVALYGVNIDWTVDDEDTGAFALDDYGNVTITCPAEGEEDIYVMLTPMLYLDDEHMYLGKEPSYLITIVADTRIQLPAPKVNINPKTGVATWNAIEHATGYRVNYYGFSVPGDYYSEYVDETIIIPADGERSVQLKDTWWISVQALGDTDTYSDSEVDPKQYNYYPETVEPDGTPLAFDLTKLTQTGTLGNPDYIFGLACGNSNTFVSASVTRVVLGNDDSNGAVTGTGFIKVGSANNDGKITLNFNKKINGVVITARQWNKDEKDKISVNGSEEQTASKNDWGVMYFNFTASKAQTKVEINTNSRVFIQSIVVYVAD